MIDGQHEVWGARGQRDGPRLPGAAPAVGNPPGGEDPRAPNCSPRTASSTGSWPRRRRGCHSGSIRMCARHCVRTLDGVPRVLPEYVGGGSIADWIRDGRLHESGETAAQGRILDFVIQLAWALGLAPAGARREASTGRAGRPSSPTAASPRCRAPGNAVSAAPTTCRPGNSPRACSERARRGLPRMPRPAHQPHRRRPATRTSGRRLLLQGDQPTLPRRHRRPCLDARPPPSLGCTFQGRLPESMYQSGAGQSPCRALRISSDSSRAGPGTVSMTTSWMVPVHRFGGR